MIICFSVRTYALCFARTLMCFWCCCCVFGFVLVLSDSLWFLWVCCCVLWFFCTFLGGLLMCFVLTSYSTQLWKIIAPQMSCFSTGNTFHSYGVIWPQLHVLNLLTNDIFARMACFHSPVSVSLFTCDFFFLAVFLKCILPVSNSNLCFCISFLCWMSQFLMLLL